MATAISGSGPAYVFVFIEALTEAGVLMGMPRDMAQTLAIETAVGAAQLAKESGTNPAILREMVTSPGGTTAAALPRVRARQIQGNRYGRCYGRVPARPGTRRQDLKSLLLFLIQILWLLLIGHVILSWLMAAGVRNDVVVRAYAAIGQILDPFMRPLRRVVPAGRYARPHSARRVDHPLYPADAHQPAALNSTPRRLARAGWSDPR